MQKYYIKVKFHIYGTFYSKFVTSKMYSILQYSIITKINVLSARTHLVHV